MALELVWASSRRVSRCAVRVATGAGVTRASRGGSASLELGTVCVVAGAVRGCALTLDCGACGQTSLRLTGAAVAAAFPWAGERLLTLRSTASRRAEASVLVQIRVRLEPLSCTSSNLKVRFGWLRVVLAIPDASAERPDRVAVPHPTTAFVVLAHGALRVFKSRDALTPDRTVKLNAARVDKVKVQDAPSSSPSSSSSSSSSSFEPTRAPREREALLVTPKDALPLLLDVDKANDHEQLDAWFETIRAAIIGPTRLH